MSENANIVTVPNKFTSVWNSKKPYQIWYGGRGSAKSWTKAIYFLLKAKQKTYSRTIFARDTQKNVRNSQYQLFKDVAEMFPALKGQFDFKDTFMKITAKASGNFLIGGSFEQPDTLRSVADPTDFWAEEPITREAQIDRDDFFDITGSLRNSHNIQTQFHFTFNPISKETWIYEDFFEKDIFDCEKLFVNYWDNPFCPASLVGFLESLKTLDYKRYKVDALGNWGIAFEGLIFPNYEAVDEMPDVKFYGLDFGFTDETALVALADDDVYGQEKKNLYVQELLYKKGLNSLPLLVEFEKIGVNKRVKIIADNARPEMIKDLKDAGYWIEPCKKYKGSPADDISRIHNYNLKIVRGSKNYFDEIKNYVWKMKNNKLLDEPEDGIEHLMDASRYGSQGFAEPIPKPLPPRKSVVRRYANG